MDASRAVLLPDKGRPWKEFSGAGNLIGWRFRACDEYFESYLSSWRRSGTNVSFEEIYARERNIFGMFVSGVSCVEAIAYAVSALASHPGILKLPFGEREQRRCSPRWLRDRLKAHPSAHTMVEALDCLLDSSEWPLWVDLRNRMTHRSNLPRRHYVSVGSAPLPDDPVHFAATSSTPDVVGDEAWFTDQFEWFAGSVGALLSGGKGFACSALQPDATDKVAPTD
jgi:hypothetical protein